MAMGQSVAKVSTHFPRGSVSYLLRVAHGCQESVLLLLDAAVMPHTIPNRAPPIASSTRQFLRTTLEKSRQTPYFRVDCDIDHAPTTTYMHWISCREHILRKTDGLESCASCMHGDCNFYH